MAVLMFENNYSTSDFILELFHIIFSYDLVSVNICTFTL